MKPLTMLNSFGCALVAIAIFIGPTAMANQYGERMMEGDYHVGRILQALKDLQIDNNTLLVFASDNGPEGEVVRDLGNQGTPDKGNSGPFRGELGEATEGAIRTCCFIRWPGKVRPDTTSYAMFSIMDPHEDIQVAGQFAWVLTPAFKEIDKYKKTLKKYPNPPPPNLTRIPPPELKKF
jgi:Sulfatase